MRAIILSAGQGKRLLPLTSDTPKCALNVGGQSLLEWQLDMLAACGVNQVTVVVGYGAEQVEQLVQNRSAGQQVETLLNADYAVSDNLVSCWMVRERMDQDFVLLNGDTLFEAAVLQRLLLTPSEAVTVTINHKKAYDADDMKVKLEGTRLVNIGKGLSSDDVDGESIGMILFRGTGPQLFRSSIEAALENPAARKRWYLSVINDMAQTMPVWTCSADGLAWCEVDYPADLESAVEVVQLCRCGVQ
ncbi:MAG: phosphocholine cytidylyltransferase family protein [Deltaproteobacteria bacterium]|nr:phosphocholine cytidylyltransferase family protein [Candidatus Anaeroferrophillus wilburensis]MBN2887719.1 phosphocholine cytidylyltransferase family protein [Deltaproteobacteria bacterium]